MNVWLAILVAALVSYGIRVLQLTLIRRPIRSVFLRSFLYYVPFVTLAVMTFPDIVLATDKLAAGVAALLVGVAIAWRKGSLVTVAAACCAVVFLLECVL